MTTSTEPARSRLLGKLPLLVAFAIALIVLVVCANQIVAFLPADEYMVIQYPTGTIKAFTEPGYKIRVFGNVEFFKRSSQFWFSALSDQGSSKDESLKLRFFDGAHASVSGSVRYDLPAVEANLLDLWRTYHNQKEVEHALIRTVMEKTVYMTGPLMTSKQAYAEKRTQLLAYIEDQAAYGIYQTSTKNIETIDPVTNEKKRVDITEVVKAPDGKIARQEDSPLVRFNIHFYNLSINEIKFDSLVEAQIQEQQKAIMAVQTSIANAKKAEQDTLTAKSQGEASAAKAKWEQEVVKATEVTKAEQEKAVALLGATKTKDVAETLAIQRKRVAELDKEAAEFKKLENIALGEGEAARARLVMEANGALEQKLSAYRDVMIAFANNLGNYKGAITPNIVMGAPAGGTANSNGLTTFMDLMTAKAAKDLQLDLSIPKAETAPKKP